MRVAATPFSNVSQLRAIDAMIEQRPDEIGLRFARACCLEDIGRPDEAQQAYGDVLHRDPRHFGTLTNLGSMALERGDLLRAWTCFQAALAVDPNDTIANINIAMLFAEQGAYDAAHEHYAFVLANRPDSLHATLHANNGLAALYERQGDDRRAAEYRERAFAKPVIWAFPFLGTGTPQRILVLASPRGGDVVSNLFFDDLTMQRTVMAPEAYRPGVQLTPHHVIFNGVGEPDKTRSTLERAIELIAASNAPVINDPRAVLRTDRAQVMANIAGIEGIIAPRTLRYTRAEITPERLAADGFTFPLLLRSPGFHTGTNFERAATPSDLEPTVAGLPGNELYAIAFTDTRSADGYVRKYRVAFIDGRPYPIHLAVAKQWKVHYFSADMAVNAEHREEERRYLDDMADVLGPGAMAALARVAETLGLDYGGVDFGRDAAGRIIVFEANATMGIFPPGDDARWDYRRRACDAAISAVRAMITARATQGGYSGS